MTAPDRPVSPSPAAAPAETPAVCECGHAKSLHQRDAKFCCASFGEQDCPCMSYRPAAPSPDRTEREPTPMTEERLAEIHGWFDENTTICWRTNVAELLAEIDRLRAAPTGEPSPDLAGLQQRALDRVLEILGAERAGVDVETTAQMYVDWAMERIDAQAAALAGLQARAAETERLLRALSDAATNVNDRYIGGSRLNGPLGGAIEELAEANAVAVRTLRPTAPPAREPEPTTTETSDVE